MQRFKSAGLVVEISQIVVHEGDEPDVLVDLLYADGLSCEDLAEVSYSPHRRVIVENGDGANSCSKYLAQQSFPLLCIRGERASAGGSLRRRGDFPSGTTSNMSCSGGVCEPTASDAVLNVSDLESMLAVGNVTVTTTGSGVQANNIDLEAPVGWSTQSLLALEASTALAIDQAVSVAGQSGLSLTTDGEIQALTFGRKGQVAFQNLSSQLTINGATYTLVNNIASLASVIASNPSGSYALVNNYDASQDGTYTGSPIQTNFTGTFDGLGNTISHLSIHDQSSTQQLLGFFSFVIEPGLIEHLHIAGAEIVGGKEGVKFNTVGTVVGYDASGYLFQDTATGKIRVIGLNGAAGGLVGAMSSGTVDSSWANVEIHAEKGKAAIAGGLAGVGVEIVDCFASGPVTVAKSGQAGGLVGANYGIVDNSYSIGTISGGVDSQVGGLIGRNRGRSVQTVYSTGAVSGGSPSYVGGFAGSNSSRLTDSYWDTDTSGTTNAVGKGNSRGITGLTTQQLQSGLPAGFDPSVWDERSNINNGLPYLLNNPPPKK